MDWPKINVDTTPFILRARELMLIQKFDTDRQGLNRETLNKYFQFIFGTEQLMIISLFLCYSLLFEQESWIRNILQHLLFWHCYQWNLSPFNFWQSKKLG